MSMFKIRKAIPEDVDDIKVLADAHKHELGFVMRPALERSIARREIIVAENYHSVVGFVEYHHRQDKQTTIYHIAVMTEYRRQGIGQALITALREEADKLGKTTIQLKCPVDLPADRFYSEIGFDKMKEEEGKARRLGLWRISP